MTEAAFYVGFICRISFTFSAFCGKLMISWTTWENWKINGESTKQFVNKNNWKENCIEVWESGFGKTNFGMYSIYYKKPVGKNVLKIQCSFCLAVQCGNRMPFLTRDALFQYKGIFVAWATAEKRFLADGWHYWWLLTRFQYICEVSDIGSGMITFLYC